MTDCSLDYIELLQQEVSRNPGRLLDVGKEEEQEEPPPPCRTLSALCSIPRRLAISAGLGGTPVTPQLTESLRRVLFGGTFHVFNYEWRRSFFQFREPKSELSYALEAHGGGARAIQMVVQARIIKHLLFNRESGSGELALHSLGEVGQQEQDRALAAALSDSLWLAGQETSATVTLVTEDYCIKPHLDYKLDTFTERLQLFTFSKKDDARKFILDHIQCAEGGSGLSNVPPAAPQLGQLCLSSGSDEPAADWQSWSTRLQRDSVLRAGRPTSATPPAGRPVPQRCGISALEPRADGARHTAAGGQHAEDSQVSSLGLLHQQQPLGPVRREPLAAVRLEDGASLPAVLLQRTELADSDGQADSRYSLPPLGGVIQRRRPRKKVSFTGNDHQDQVGRSCHQLERHPPLLLNTGTMVPQRLIWSHHSIPYSVFMITGNWTLGSPNSTGRSNRAAQRRHLNPKVPPPFFRSSLLMKVNKRRKPKLCGQQYCAKVLSHPSSLYSAGNGK